VKLTPTLFAVITVLAAVLPTLLALAALMQSLHNGSLAVTMALIIDDVSARIEGEYISTHLGFSEQKQEIAALRARLTTLSESADIAETARAARIRESLAALKHEA
jgi:hypothetical protein